MSARWVAAFDRTLLAVVVDELHTKHVHIEVANLRVIGHLVIDVIEGHRFEGHAAGHGCLRPAAGESR